jgi:N-acetylneuraminic acid mutarotase
VALRKLIGRLGRGRLTLLAAGLLSVAAILVLLGLGSSVPGPKVRVLLGLVDEIESCVPGPEGALLPAGSAAPHGRWRTEPPMPALHDEPRAVAIDGRIYVGTGLVLTDDRLGMRSRSSLLVFDPSDGSYRSTSAVPVRIDHPVLAAYRGDLYLVGGFSDGKPSARAWRFDTSRGGWTELAEMRVARGGLAGAVIGDRLYVVGGTSRFSDESAPPYATMEIYDFGANRWSEGPPMPTPRHHLGAAALAGRLYAIGGRAPKDLSLDVVERFDPATGRWERMPPLPTGVGGLAVVTAGSRIVAIAGGDDRERWVTPAVWGLDADALGWARLRDLSVARHGHAATVTGGRIYVFGGAPCAGFGQTTSVESIRSAP